MLDRDLVSREQAYEISQELARTRTQQQAGEHLHRRARRGGARYHTELASELLAWNGDLQRSAGNHSLYFNHLKRKGSSSHRECGSRGRRRDSAWRAGFAWGRRLGVTARFEQGSLETGKTSTVLPGLLDARGQLLHQVVHRAILANQACDLGRRVDDRRVVAAAEVPADAGQ